MRIGAHRGWTRHGPENTVPAILGAADAAEFVELDVRRSVDGVAVLAHDPVIGGLEVAASTAGELAALDLGGGVGVPTLAELMAAGPLPLDIEIKPEVVAPDFVEQVCALARPGDFVSSFNWEICAAVRSAAPTVPTGLLVEGPGRLEPALERSADGHRWVLPFEALVTPELVARSHAAGLLVGTWTVNSPERAAALRDYGVDAVISDHPDRIRPEVLP